MCNTIVDALHGNMVDRSVLYPMSCWLRVAVAKRPRCWETSCCGRLVTPPISMVTIPCCTALPTDWSIPETELATDGLIPDMLLFIDWSIPVTVLFIDWSIPDTALLPDWSIPEMLPPILLLVDLLPLLPLGSFRPCDLSMCSLSFLRRFLNHSCTWWEVKGEVCECVCVCALLVRAMISEM